MNIHINNLGSNSVIGCLIAEMHKSNTPDVDMKEFVKLHDVTFTATTHDKTTKVACEESDTANHLGSSLSFVETTFHENVTTEINKPVGIAYNNDHGFTIVWADTIEQALQVTLD